MWHSAMFKIFCEKEKGSMDNPKEYCYNCKRYVLPETTDAWNACKCARADANGAERLDEKALQWHAYNIGEIDYV